MPHFALLSAVPPVNLARNFGLLLLTLAATLSSQAGALTATATTLIVNPGISITQGTVLTLQAAVNTSSSPVLRGAVTFYDGTKVLTAVQLVNSGSAYTHGKANFKVLLAAGDHALKAVYNGASTFAASTSAATTVSVTFGSPAATTTSISATGSNGTYTLTGKVAAASSTLPTGAVQFEDQSNNNFVLRSPLLDPSTLASGWPSLTSVSAASPNYGVVIADFNGDGIPDFVTSNFGGSTLSIYLGHGDGTFGAHVDYTVGSYSLGLAVGDLNGDGVPDIAVANGNGSEVSVLLGNGDGTLQPVRVNATAGISGFLVMADVNGDGFLDLVTCSSGSFAVTVLLGSGDGNFASQQSYGTSTLTRGIALGDFNRDGFLDLAVSNSNSNTISVLLGNGDGTFPTQTTYPVSVGPTSIAVADLNGDGKQDLVVCNSAGATITVLIGAGDGTFPTQVSYASATGPWGVVAADLNGDGIPDLLVTSPSNHLFQLFQGKGDGTLLAPVSSSTGVTSYVTALGDLNGDGVTDVIVSNLDSGNTVLVGLGYIWETATLANITLPGGGLHSVVATYAGDSNFAPSTSDPIALEGTVLPTTLAVSVDPPIGAPGQTFAITAAVSPASAGGYTASGTVSLFDGALNIASALPLVNGAATINRSDFTIGTHPITATYTGDTNFTASSTSSSASLTVLQPQTVSFPALGPVTYRLEPVVLSATASSGLPVVFSVFSGPGILSGNALTLTGAGNVVIQAAQSGDSTYAPAPPVQTTLVVNQAMSVVGLTASSANIAAGATVTFTGIVAAPPLPVPTGRIVFTDGSTQLASVAVDSSGSAGYTTSALTVGAHTIVATYSGDANFVSAMATPLTITVTTSGPTPDYTVTANPASLSIPRGSRGTSVITVNPTGGFTGQITFACAGLPQFTTCTFAPTTVTLSGDDTAHPVQFTLITPPKTAAFHPPAGTDNGTPNVPMLAIASPFGLLALLSLCKRRAHVRGASGPPGLMSLAPMSLVLMPLALGMLILSSCGGAGNSTGGGVHQVPLGTSNVTMTAATMGGSLHHSATIAITITP